MEIGDYHTRCLWVCVVAAGFTIAAVLIKGSFDNWADNQIATTIETLPISAVTFPKVCTEGLKVPTKHTIAKFHSAWRRPLLGHFRCDRDFTFFNVLVISYQ